MALRNIVLEGDEILRKRAREVTEINDRIRMILDDMVETMREKQGSGIAAPQVGILKRMLIADVDGEIIELINPEILETEGAQTEDEGCLSIPGFIGTVERPAYIKMKGLNREGQEVVYEGSGFLPIVLSHEYDHLEGILYTDKAVNIREADRERDNGGSREKDGDDSPNRDSDGRKKDSGGDPDRDRISAGDSADSSNAESKGKSRNIGR